MPPVKTNVSIRTNCFNPFQKQNHFEKKNLSAVSGQIKLNFPSLPSGSKICLKCKAEFYSSVSKSNDKKSREFISQYNNKILNQCDNDYHRDGVTTLEQIKEKFKLSSNKNERISLLTLAPKYWSRTKLMTEFNSTEREARLAQDLVKKHGILTTPNPIKGKSLCPETEVCVRNFYLRDDISRVMPGMKDFISVKQDDGSRVHVQKRLLLCNLKELYTQFGNEYKDIKIGFTTFTKLRPPQCVLAGASGTHTVCVCVHHENVKLMIQALNLENLTKDSEKPLKNYHDCINAIVCTNSRNACFLGECELCRDITKFKNYMIKLLDDNKIDDIKFDIWTQTDRCTLKTQVMESDEFVNDFCERLLKLKTHDFIAKNQSLYVKNLKDNLKKDEFIVCLDFAENYSFVIQNAAQSFHWNNDQATICTAVIYYKQDLELKHKSMAIISDNLNHDTVAVHEYQKIICNYLKTNFENPKKIYYVTDGAGQHFKNKSNFVNLLAHEKDFGISAEWHFQATAHGKGGCDGIGANIKRHARLASLQRSSGNHILNAKDLYLWAKNFCKETEIFFSSKESYETAVNDLKERFEKAETIKGTLQYHAFIPIAPNTLQLKKLSSAEEYTTFVLKEKKRKQVAQKNNLKKKNVKTLKRIVKSNKKKV